MKKLVNISSLDLIDKIRDYVDGYIVGLKDYSVNMGLYLDLEEISKLVSENEKEIYIAINKNIRNSEIDDLKSKIESIINIPISGILYYDMAVYQLCPNKELLVWSQEHATTNYATINYFKSKGVDKVYLSSEITIDEMTTIKDKTDSTLYANVMGYIPIFLSKRYLVSNYKKHFNIEDNSNIYYMKKEGKSFPLLETDDGTIVFNSEILNAYDDLDNLENIIDYAIFNSFLIPDDTFLKVLKVFSLKEGKNKVDMLLNYKTSDLFMHKETIYKVIK